MTDLIVSFDTSCLQGRWAFLTVGCEVFFFFDATYPLNFKGCYYCLRQKCTAFV